MTDTSCHISRSLCEFLINCCVVFLFSGMGSCDDVLHLMADDSIEKDQAAQMTGNFQNGAGKRNGGETTAKFKKESMGNVTKGDEDHVVIRVHECESEEAETQKDKVPQRKNGCVDGQFVINGFEHSDNAGRNEKNTIQDSEDLSLKGQFVVHESQNEDSSLVKTDSDPQVLDKTLTLAVCSPTLSTSTRNNDTADTPILITAQSDEEHDDNEDLNEAEINEDINQEDIGFTLNLDNTYTDNDIETRNADIKSESTERNEQKTVSTNNYNTCNEKKETRVLNRATVQPRTNMKHGKSRYKLEDAMPEIDETTDNVLDSVVRANKGAIEDRAKSINPKTSWKNENKSPARNKIYPIKKDLHDDISQTRNSSLKRTGSPSLKHSTTGQDIIRLNASFADDEITKINTNALGNSFISSIPNVSYDYGGDSRHSRLSFHCTTPRDVQNNERKGTFTSIFQRRYTKKELHKALPRKSFFSCHDRAMKDAGLEVEDPVSKRKAERLKAKLERIAKEFDPLPSKVIIETGKVNNGIHATDEHKEVSIILTDAQGNIPDPNEGDDMNSDVNENRINSEDMVDARINLDNSIHTVSKKKRLHPEKNDHVECKPLVQYLEYVKDNQLEYENYRQSSVTTSSTHKPIRRLISMGKAFELRHRGGTFKAKGDDVIVMAAKALRPRSSDASRYFKHDDKSGLRGQDPSLAALRQVRPPSDDKRRQEKNAATSITAKDDEHHAKTELERKKIRAEEWAMSVSTNTLTKAKIQSLRELGADDEELTKWWVALRKCHYLRTNAPVAESL